MAGTSFWNCPICLRHVPDRVSECYCGRKRQPGDRPDLPETRSLARSALAVTLIAFVAVLMMLRRPAPAGTASPPQPAPREAAVTMPPATPERPSVPSAVLAPLPGTTPSAAATSEALLPVTVTVPKPTPTPADSVDAQRERGVAAYEAAMKGLASQLGELRARVKHFNQECPGSGGLGMGPSGAERVLGCDVPREEIGRLLREFQTALDEADEAARHSWVEPGVQRTIRERSAMDEVSVGEALAAATAALRR